MERPLEPHDPIPESWREQVVAALEPGEVPVAWLETDLDEAAHFARGLLVVTNRRFLRWNQPENSLATTWPLDRIERLSFRERAGLGALEAHGGEGLVWTQPYTSRCAVAVHVFTRRFEHFRREGIPLDQNATENDPDDAPPPPAPVRIFALFRMFRYARAHFGAILLGSILTLATTAASLIPPYLTMPLVDDVLIPYQNQVTNVLKRTGPDPTVRDASLAQVQQANRDRFAKVPWLLGGLAGAAIAAWLLGWAQGYTIARASERITADLRNQTYAHLHHLSLEFFGGRRTGDLIARISNDTERICTFLSDSLLDFATDCLMILGVAVILFSMDPLLAAATFLTFPINAWLVLRARDRLSLGYNRGGRAWSEMTNVLTDTLPGIRVVKAFAQERREVRRFEESNIRVVEADDRVNAVWTFFWPLVVLLNQGGLLVVWGVGSWRVYDHHLTVGALTLFLTYITRFYTRLESMSRIITATQRAATSAGRLLELLDRKSSVPEPIDPVIPDKIAGAIELRDVGFRYGTRTVLQNVNLTIQPGEMIGLVGPSGAGKSTLVNLLCRFYDVSDGAILVDGIDLRRLSIMDYRKHLGLVLQEPFLFFGTIADNIAYGRPNATRAQIVAAARAAKAHDFILRLTDGYDTHVGERGQALSGGERQRISIARALLIDPAILILDEATSSVDTETEREIQEALDNLTRGRTTIAIAHRLSTLRKADRLVVLEQGRIVEVGHHRDLLKRRGLFERLHRAQVELAQGLSTT